MKICAASLLLSLVFAQANAANVQPEPARASPVIEIAGTGLKSVLPPGFSYPRIGTYLADESRAAAIMLTIMPLTDRDPEHDSAYLKGNYPEAPAAFNNGKLDGRLYNRLRTGNIGNWDAEWLSVNRMQTQLAATLANYGPPEGTLALFQRAQPFFDRLEWDEKAIDSEIAFGARFKIPGLTAVRKLVGMLLYNTTGEQGFKEPNLIISAPALARVFTTDDEFRDACSSTLSRMFSKVKYEGPFNSAGNGLRLCDGHGPDNHGNTMFVALAKLPSGDIISAIGRVPERMKSPTIDNLRQAILNVELLR